MQDRRQSPEPATLDPALVSRGKKQLEQEILLLRGWLAQLDETSKDNTESQAARKNYGDMLQSREDLLAALTRK